MSDTLAPASGTGAPSPSSSAPAAGTAPVAGGEPAQATSGSGELSSASVTPTPGAPSEPPKERWNDILANARTKARTEAESEFKQRYSKYDTFERDPWTGVSGWLEQASQHSIYGPMVQGWVEKYVEGILAKSGPESFGEEPKPDIPVVDDRGQVTHHVYSDGKLREWHKWQKQHDERGLNERLRPMEQQLQSYQQAAQQAAQQQAAHQHLQQFESLPYFKEHKDKIAKAFADHPEWGANVHAAYTHVLVNDILPTLATAERKQVVDSLNSNASSGTVNPAGTTVASPHKFKSFREAAKYYEAHPEEAEAMANR